MKDKPIIVFLDFDGVLHPRVGGGGFSDSCISALAEAIESFEIAIVISSSWRLTCHMEELKTLLQALGKPVIGKTPESPAGIEHKRYEEICAYLDRNGLDAVWLAIDDARHFFPAGTPLFLTDPETGFTDADISRLQRLIISLNDSDSSDPSLLF